MHTTTDKHKEKEENTETMVVKNRKSNIESLQNASTKFLYQQKLTNKLNRNECTDTEEMYNYLEKCIYEAEKEALEEKKVNKGRKTMFWDAEIEKERQNKKQLFLKCLSTKENNNKVQYKKKKKKIRRMVANYRNKFWDEKCLEIHTYLRSKKSPESWKYIKNIRLSISGKSQIKLISAHVWEKYYYKLSVEGRKEFLDKYERLLKKV
jgi:hypothetical protein